MILVLPIPEKPHYHYYYHHHHHHHHHHHYFNIIIIIIIIIIINNIITYILSVFNWQPVSGTGHMLQPQQLRTCWRIRAVIIIVIIIIIIIIIIRTAEATVYNVLKQSSVTKPAMSFEPKISQLFTVDVIVFVGLLF